MSYEKYAQIETLVLEMPYEQKIQLLSMIADNLKNTKVIETVHSQTKKIKRCFGIAKGEFSYPRNFDEDNDEIAKLFGTV
ncbi:DUF2281 domain-containing protein [Treponema parvum]|uniref:DUF2281 domain-containing protein n=1 Tax=Treponema parvum TaxID=138851 RepID=A0A975F1K8_9SPIR|nr:DUF2281 domain-containing protein [Treponema parvum]QTQ12682.1 DUF2281 domain-containing protein [Treponema parvum]QTQ15341.1 DUF2281 domain-containing protein [Treponema parvum]